MFVCKIIELSEIGFHGSDNWENVGAKLRISPASSLDELKIEIEFF